MAAEEDVATIKERRSLEHGRENRSSIINKLESRLPGAELQWTMVNSQRFWIAVVNMLVQFGFRVTRVT